MNNIVTNAQGFGFMQSASLEPPQTVNMGAIVAPEFIMSGAQGYDSSIIYWADGATSPMVNSKSPEYLGDTAIIRSVNSNRIYLFCRVFSTTIPAIVYVYEFFLDDLKMGTYNPRKDKVLSFLHFNTYAYYNGVQTEIVYSIPGSDESFFVYGNYECLVVSLVTGNIIRVTPLVAGTTFSRCVVSGISQWVFLVDSDGLCYGMDLATGAMVDYGYNIGSVTPAAYSDGFSYFSTESTPTPIIAATMSSNGTIIDTKYVNTRVKKITFYYSGGYVIESLQNISDEKTVSNTVGETVYEFRRYFLANVEVTSLKSVGEGGTYHKKVETFNVSATEYNVNPALTGITSTIYANAATVFLNRENPFTIADTFVDQVKSLADLGSAGGTAYTSLQSRGGSFDSRENGDFVVSAWGGDKPIYRLEERNDGMISIGLSLTYPWAICRIPR